MGHMTLPVGPSFALEYGQLTHNGLSRRQAIKQLAVKYNVTTKKIFNELETAK